MFGYSKYFHRLHIYIVPKGFSQCLVIMVYHHPVTRLNIPVFLSFCKVRNTRFFFNAIGAAIGQCDFRLQGRSVTLDFEQGLIKAVVEQFSRFYASFTGNKVFVVNFYLSIFQNA